MTTRVKDQQKRKVKPKVPSYDAFRKEIREIYPEGNLFRTYERIVGLVNDEKSCADGSPVTYRLIMDKFSDHIRQWNMVYGSRDPKYWGKDAEEKRKTLWDFISSRWYERDFNSCLKNEERRKYLFGDFTIDYLHQQLKVFKRRFPHETG
jgi:hypothetical protein